jgi:hypothetical protein
VSLASPKLGVPLKNARWELWLPPDYEYRDFSGSMVHAAAAAPVSRSYSLGAYNDEEANRGQIRRKEVAVAIDNLKNQLSSGKFNNPNGYLQQALNNREVADAQQGKDLEGLEQQFKRSQGGRLIEAQRNYSIENNARFGVQMPGQMAAPRGQAGPAGQQQQLAVQLDYEEGVAERQWVMLCKSQELTATRTHTLRVNLPKRGLQHGFSQVLQTEVNKPMTVAFLARNTRSTSWTALLGMAGGGFAVIWLLAGAALQRREVVRK